MLQCYMSQRDQTRKTRGIRKDTSATEGFLCVTIPPSETSDYLWNYVVGDLSLVVQLTAITHTVNSM